MARLELKRLLLPTDFSEYAAAATPYACGLAEQFNAELHVLHVLEVHVTAVPVFGAGLALPSSVMESKEAARNTMAGLLDHDWTSGRRVVYAIVEGSPFVEILRYAKEHDIDLIVLGTHGRTGLAHTLIGSVAERVVRESVCPVLTVHSGGHRFAIP